MHVLVTGGSGQLGSAVVRALLADGHRVRCIVLHLSQPDLLAGLPVELREGDVTRPESLPPAFEGIDAVIHMAGIVSYARTDRARTRLPAVFVDGTRHALQASADAGVGRFLLTSSIAALGYLPDGATGDESTPWNWGPLDIPYFAAKKGAEDLVLAERRLEALAVNPGIVFGEGDLQRNGARTLLQIASGRMPGVPPGATTAANLDDVARGHLLALRSGRPGQRYILGGHPMTFRELYDRIGEVVGRPAPRRTLSPSTLRLVARVLAVGSAFTGREPGLTPALAEISIRNRRFSSEKAVRELGYAPQPLSEGIGACWRWLGDRGTPLPSTG